MMMLSNISQPEADTSILELTRQERDTLLALTKAEHALERWVAKAGPVARICSCRTVESNR